MKHAAPLILLAALGGCEARGEQVSQTVQVAYNSAGWYMSAHVDPETGCQYLRLNSGRELTPRVSADGHTHMGCKGESK